MKAALLTLLPLLLLAHVRGQRDFLGRCKCLDAGVNRILPRNIAKLEVHPPSHACQRMEIIVTLKDNGTSKCLNPDSQLAKNYIKNVVAKRDEKTFA